MYFFEHVIARSYHWSLEEIRAMDYQDFIIHLQLCLAYENFEKEFVAKTSRIAGGINSNPSSNVQPKGSGAVKEVRTENIVKF